jgi:8-oxo-dGTP diphosphatase
VNPPREVVAAVIERDGKVLICRRRADSRHPLKWEFPGGKVEPEETPAAALARELQEELGIQAVIGAEIVSFVYQYPGRAPILLRFFQVREYSGTAVNREFEEIRWEQQEKLPNYDFLEADSGFVRDLAHGAAG